MIRKIMITSVAAVILIAAYGSGTAKETANAKVLFHSPGGVSTTTPNDGATTHKLNINPGRTSGGDNPSGITNYYQQLSNPGIHVWIELESPGTRFIKRVNENHVFKTGNKIRIHVAANSAGRLYALHTGSSGTAKVLPVSTDGTAVSAGNDYVIPSNGGWLKFDQNKGVETIKLVLTPGKPDEGTTVQLPVASTQSILEMYDRFSSSKGLLHGIQGGTKDLIVDGEWKNSALTVQGRSRITPAQQVQLVNTDPGHYIVNTQGEPVAYGITLKHR